MSFQRFRVTSSLSGSQIQKNSLVPACGRPVDRDGPEIGNTRAPGAQFQSFRVALPASPVRVENTSTAHKVYDSRHGSTHTFPSLEAFQLWLAQEEEEKVVEFVQSDRHPSRANPPRFKEHVKLVCARHGRNGAKKYVKKYPDRKRKWGSVKIGGEGCPASIGYKTFEGTDEVRVTYNPEHSHPIGEDNFAFTRKGRKIMNEQGVRILVPQNPSPVHTTLQLSTPEPPQTEPSTASPQLRAPTAQQHAVAPPPVFELSLPFAFQNEAQITSQHPEETPSAVAMPPVLPMSTALPISPQILHATQLLQLQAFTPFPPLEGTSSAVSQPENPAERWERLDALFQSVRDAARTFTFPMASISALEAVLLRLYLDSPVVAATASALLESSAPTLLGGENETLVSNHNNGMTQALPPQTQVAAGPAPRPRDFTRPS